LTGRRLVGLARTSFAFRALTLSMNLVTGIFVARLLGTDGRGEYAAIIALPFGIAWLIKSGCKEAIAYHQARHPLGRRLNHDQAVPLSARGERHAHRAGQRVLHRPAVHEAGSLDRVSQTACCDLGEHPASLGTIAEDRAAKLRQAFAGALHRGHQCGHPLLGDVPPGEHHQMLGW